MVVDPQFIFDILFKAIASVAVVIGIFQLIEVRKKRMVEMYWKVAEIYLTEDQRSARKNIWTLQTGYLKERSTLSDTELIDNYNHDYHDINNEVNKAVDNSIIDRIRFLNQIGVLLSKRLDAIFTTCLY